MPSLDRRSFLRAALAAGSGAALGCATEAPPPQTPASPPTPSGAPAIVPADRARPLITHGVQSGDVTHKSGIVWARSDRLARMVVEWDTDPSFSSPRKVSGPVATADSDFTTRVDLADLPAGSPIHYRVVFEDPDSRASSEPISGSFNTAPIDGRDVVFAWSGDTAGQGWGINLEWGGMKMYETVRRAKPDFFIHCGDLVYCDSPIPPEITLQDGAIWKNVTTEAKSHVAETLADFRGNYAYNLMDKNVQRFNAEVPQLVMWDDHEVRNNWYPGEVLDDEKYTERSCKVLMGRARQAMGEYTPMRPEPGEPGRVYRTFHRGPLLDVFLLDERSYRNDNGPNREPTLVPFLGPAQVAWLKEGLQSSRATWKVIATDMPLALIVAGRAHGRVEFDGWANDKDGPPLGRELELADLLRFIKRQKIKNVVFVTADVHYAAAHHFDPARASHRDFDPFWEFVAGPMHANTYGPNQLDPTFGPEVRYASPPSGKTLKSPHDGGQYFGTMKIDGKSKVMTVTLIDLAGTKLYSVDLPPA